MKCNVIDAGARYGLHPTWQNLETLAKFFLFETDKTEADRLRKKYRKQKNINVFSYGLFDSNCEKNLKSFNHQALSSLFQSNKKLLKDYKYMLSEFSLRRTMKVKLRSIDSLFPKTPIHFLKLDVEGSELSILQGANKQLNNHILGIRAEVCFAPIFQDAPLFGEIHKKLINHGFELLNFDYNGIGNKSGIFALPGRSGKLLSSDAVWVKKLSLISGKQKESEIENKILLATFLMNNNATDLAIELLLKLAQQGSNFFKYRKDPIFQLLRKQILILFKKLLSVPQIEKNHIFKTYKIIFSEEFPQMSNFYQENFKQK